MVNYECGPNLILHVSGLVPRENQATLPCGQINEKSRLGRPLAKKKKVVKCIKWSSSTLVNVNTSLELLHVTVHQ